MSYKGFRYLVCPNCGKRGVYWSLTSSDDCWICRYCGRDEDGFTCFSYGEDPPDVRDRRRLAEANPEADVWVTDVTDAEPAS